jgi:AraC family transcriptional regulator of adaptative response / DNA-3-methyladenine glycosylase II
MDLSNKANLYKIVCARDKRYDGRFYCVVETTGVYCRPICPARPKIENISFVRSAAEAEKLGFRACLRCRPDLAPNSVQWNGTAATVGRALTMIARGDADGVFLSTFAQRLGVSDRHLRRLFDEHVGASPVEVATSKRLHLARQLLSQSSLPVTEVAFASGFRSIRRFNESFKDAFQIAPSVVRKTAAVPNETDTNFIKLEIPVIEPFDWPHIFGFLKNHHAQGVESASEHFYRRSFAVGNAIGGVEVSFDKKRSHIAANVFCADTSHLRSIIAKVKTLFDAELNPHAHLQDLDGKHPIAACYVRQLGIRIPGAWDPFETAVTIILGQLVSVEQARYKVKKLVQEFGKKIQHPIFENCSHLFPTAETLMNANLKNIGVTKVREHSIQELSRQVCEGKIDLSRSCDIETTKTQLLAIKGIGPWTAEMIAMRCLGDTNAFPKNDLIIKRALEMHHSLTGDWSPWNSYISLALWKTYAAALSKKGTKSRTTK